MEVPVGTLIKDLEEGIKNIYIENVDTKIIKDEQNNVRSKAVRIISNYYSNKKNQKLWKNEMKDNYLTTKRFLKQSLNLIITRSDKGNNTVIMKKEECIKEMNKLLEDRNTYSILNKDPTNRFDKLANNLTIKLQNESIISEEIGKNLKSYNSVAPKLYGLRKTHKKECALRPVVYVDDVITAIPRDRMDQTLKTFNTVNNKIQLTMEVKNNGTLPFLDMNIIRNEDSSIVTNWYVKPTSSGRCINYNSNHPMSQKVGIIRGLLFRALTLIKINSISTKLKDKVNKLEQSNLVYKLPYVCDKCYIGQTKQKLKKRVEQQKNDCKPINAQKSNISALAEHHFITGHKFKFEETNILDKEDRHHNMEDT
ncbi:hypothetical protein M0804_015570 [Polistes exclamans]|nr:hypothetical protein M0804_015570 [Polistes exclamans]